jgi:hypothetical protein
VRRSTQALLLCYLVILLVHFLYYPKWKQEGAEATISYDVSGYYMYLPAAFVYQDLKKVGFLGEVFEAYKPSGHPYQAYDHESGNRVMKYSIGQAVIYTPFFLVGHAWASISQAYPADGFSLPYQFSMSMGSLIISFLGLFWLVSLLRVYFRDGVVAVTILLVALGTNYLNYAAIDGAMTHNTVFSLAALLLLTSHRFYVRATLSRAAIIGACLGFMALTRPTEITAALIPLLWGLNLTQKGAIAERLKFFGEHYGKLLIAAAITLAIGFIQLAYWKYVTGDWIVYSYQDQGFDWFKAHIAQGLYSYKAGWLVYTPLMVFSLIGFIPLFRRKTVLFPALFLHSIIFIYVAFAWSVWWYGGSLGQRTMVQQYAVLSFPMAAFIDWLFWARPTKLASMLSGAEVQVQGEVEKQGRGPLLRITQAVIAAVMALFIWHNAWFTHQAHRGGLFLTEQMTKTYFWRTLYTFGYNPEDRLTLDNDEFFTAEPSGRETLYFNDLENLSTEACGLSPIKGVGSLCLVDEKQNGPGFYLYLDLPAGTWLRATVDCKINKVRGSKDDHAQMVLSFRRNGEEIKRNLIRMHRVLNHDWRRKVSLDGRVPAGADQAVVSFWNGGKGQPGLVLDDVTIETIW